MENESQPVETQVEEVASERPEWLPEKFKSPEELANSYASLEQRMGQGEDALRSKLIEEFEAAALENRPASAGDYQIPEMIDPELATDNELFNWWAEHAYENAYSQEEFEAGIQKYAEILQAQQPDLDAERAKLGDNAQARIEAVDLWANKFFPENYKEAVLQIGQTAEGIQALEYIMQQMGSSSPSDDSQPLAQTSEKDLRSMMMDDRYWNPAKRDAAYVQKVQEGFSKLYR
jgi:hypothetical protein